MCKRNKRKKKSQIILQDNPLKKVNEHLGNKIIENGYSTPKR